MARRKKLPVILERDQIAAIKRVPNTRCPTGLRNRAILEVMHRAGLRISEVRKLRRGDVGWQGGMIEVRGGKGGVDRAVPADEATMVWLRAWDSRRPRGRTFFSTLKGGPLDARYLQRLVKRLAVKAGIDRPELVTPHKFRHAYATELLAEGFNIREVQVLLGHASVATTEVYTHVRPVGLAEKVRQRAI